jgi:hypothetical protein
MDVEWPFIVNFKTQVLISSSFDFLETFCQVFPYILAGLIIPVGALTFNFIPYPLCFKFYLLN